MILKLLKMTLLSLLEINMISQKRFFKPKIKFKIYYVIFVNILASQKSKLKKGKSRKLKNPTIYTIFVMTGYHSMRKPDETLELSKTDIVLKSNHVDFVLKRLVHEISSFTNWRELTQI